MEGPGGYQFVGRTVQMWNRYRADRRLRRQALAAALLRPDPLLPGERGGAAGAARGFPRRRLPAADRGDALPPARLPAPSWPTNAGVHRRLQGAASRPRSRPSASAGRAAGQADLGSHTGEPVDERRRASRTCPRTSGRWTATSPAASGRSMCEVGQTVDAGPGAAGGRVHEDGNRPVAPSMPGTVTQLLCTGGQPGRRRPGTCWSSSRALTPIGAKRYADSSLEPRHAPPAWTLSAGDLTPTPVWSSRDPAAHSAEDADDPVWIHRLSEAEQCSAYAGAAGRARTRATCRSTASPSPSRTTSTWPACRPPPACPDFAYTPGAQRHRGPAADRRRRHPDRQDQPGPVRHRPGRHALALWRLPQRLRPGLHLRRIQLGLGGGGGPGLASFSLGTDTAGSGRVPAAFNNLVGLKPTRGLALHHRAWCRPAGLARLRVDLRPDRRTPAPCWPSPPSFDPADPYASAGEPTASTSAAPRTRPSASACRASAAVLRRRGERAPVRGRRRPACRGSAARRSPSTSRPSARPPACSTRAPGWPSAMPPSSPSSRRTPRPCSR